MWHFHDMQTFSLSYSYVFCPIALKLDTYLEQNFNEVGQFFADIIRKLENNPRIGYFWPWQLKCSNKNF